MSKVSTFLFFKKKKKTFSSYSFLPLPPRPARPRHALDRGAPHGAPELPGSAFRCSSQLRSHQQGQEVGGGAVAAVA